MAVLPACLSPFAIGCKVVAPGAGRFTFADGMMLPRGVLLVVPANELKRLALFPQANMFDRFLFSRMRETVGDFPQDLNILGRFSSGANDVG
ncbi:hypothetical protein GGX14DRAFT_565693 [Mycena pura]|uniref:Uncharacterized protein n=1 Tax=Mycena pura TaxID=153505 RepID=A0AAD6VIC5_9AGAR|nr:hypothetical protein GGX14DRAFT_565693 [Mycena pura]